MGEHVPKYRISNANQMASTYVTLVDRRCQNLTHHFGNYLRCVVKTFYIVFFSLSFHKMLFFFC